MKAMGSILNWVFLTGFIAFMLPTPLRTAKFMGALFVISGLHVIVDRHRLSRRTARDGDDSFSSDLWRKRMPLLIAACGGLTVVAGVVMMLFW